MEKGDIKYNYHFYHMVTTGLICGLSHPIEWLCSYDRCIGEPYEMYNEISEFVKIAGVELLTLEMAGCEGKKEYTIEDVNKWINEYYNTDTQKIIHRGI